ncbi:MAG: hypothetical protein KDE26_07080 [Bacteroidetes bacterium]|nr:hypothetical protein [Bacteroidota bacterium]
MKKIIYLTGFWLLGFSLWTGSVSAQAVFNDTIYFQILKTRPTNIGAKYLMTFGTEAGSTNSFTGKMVLSLCACYCDSIWDAWPKTPSDSLMTGGKATLSHSSSGGGGSPGIFGTDGPGRFRGRLNIWQMPGSFSLTEAFTLPVTFTVD